MSIASHTHPPHLELVVFDVPPECLVAGRRGARPRDRARARRDAAPLDPSGELVTLDLRALTFMDVARPVRRARRPAPTRAQTGRRLQILGPRCEAARVLELTGTRDLVS